jgi:tetratricopeptide (TPR) repeat protein
MKPRYLIIGIIVLVALSACDATTREARRMVKRAEQLADTLPDSAVRLIDSVLRVPASFSERERMDIALLQAEALFGDRGQEISPVMDDDFFDDHTTLSTSPELERAAAYYAGKRQYAKAAHAALYSGFVQQHFNEKETAMRSFKEAEQYGKLAIDSLTVAQAEYWMGKMLYDEGREQEALNSLMVSERFIGDRYADKATIENSKAVVFILMSQNDSAYICIQQGLAWAENAHYEKASRKILNNNAVLCRLQGKYDDAIAHLRQMASTSDLDETEMFVFYLNMGKTFTSAKEIDSAELYFKHVESLLSSKEIKLESKTSACGALSQFAEQQGDIQKALKFKNQREELLSKVLAQRQEQAVFRIQKQYDYESLQNEMNQKLIRKQRLITIIGIFAIIGLTALAISQIRLAKTRKQEAETKANLFHFMQQNKELAQQSEEQKQNQIFLTQKHKESEQAYEDLLKEKQRYEQAASEYGEKLAVGLKKEQAIMLRLHLFLENQGDEELLRKLEKSVFGKHAHLDAMMENVDLLYPHLREIIKQEELRLDENEQLDVIMSYFNISRQDEALLLDKTTDMVDKIRNRSRKKIQSASEGKDWPKIK